MWQWLSCILLVRLWPAVVTRCILIRRLPLDFRCRSRLSRSICSNPVRIARDNLLILLRNRALLPVSLNPLCWLSAVLAKVLCIRLNSLSLIRALGRVV